MTIVMFACSQKSYFLMKELREKWIKLHPSDNVIEKVKCSGLSEISEKASLSDMTGEWFEQADALIFFSAAGIAVRSIAPYLKHKSTDPAVLVIDETGKFCISLLSGHTGGANAQTLKIAELFKERDMIPVITTATDREGKFAVDEFARKNDLAVTDYDLAKEISVKILSGEKIGFTADLEIIGELPGELIQEERETGIVVSYKDLQKLPYAKTLQLVPRTLCVGVGCRRDTPLEKIEAAIDSCFQEEKLLQSAIMQLASIDLKKQEKGILAYCEKHKIPFVTYSAKELETAEGAFTSSSFVAKVTGVDNVCERSAFLSGGALIVGKKSYDGVTVAVAEKTGRLIV